MPEPLKNYNPARVAIVFGLIPINGGLGENVFVKITPADQMYKKKRGADGSVARAKSNAFDGQIEITLMAPAVANGLLSAQATLGEYGPNGGDVSPITISDLDSAQSFFAEEAWIAQRPEIEFGNEVGERTWILEYANSAREDGGS